MEWGVLAPWRLLRRQSKQGIGFRPNWFRIGHLAELLFYNRQSGNRATVS